MISAKQKLELLPGDTLTIPPGLPAGAGPGAAGLPGPPSGAALGDAPLVPASPELSEWLLLSGPMDGAGPGAEPIVAVLLGLPGAELGPPAGEAAGLPTRLPQGVQRLQVASQVPLLT